MSTFSGLSVALSSLQSQRRAMDVVGQNVANVNTPGYTRQRAEMAPIAPSNVMNMWGTPLRAGNGVEVVDIARLGDEVATARLRGQTALAGYHARSAQNYDQIQNSLGEPSDTGLTEQLAQMFSAWGDVSNNASDPASLAVLQQRSAAVADVLRERHEGVVSQWDSVHHRVGASVEALTTEAANIAHLNKEIFKADTAELPHNELLDRRDQLITKLTRMADVTVTPMDGGMVQLSLGGQVLVDGVNSTTVSLTGTAAFPGATPGSTGIAVDGTAVTVDSGELAADLNALNAALPRVAGGYDAVATGLMNLVNGETGQAFFAGSGAADITVAITDPAAINTSTVGRDGAIADAIVARRNEPTAPDSAWAQIIGEMGVQADSANQRAATAENTRLAAENALSAATGVDIDEEMTNLVSTQRAYQAAGKLMATIDSMLDTLINGIGR